MLFHQLMIYTYKFRAGDDSTPARQCQKAAEKIDATDNLIINLPGLEALCLSEKLGSHPIVCIKYSPSMTSILMQLA